MRCPTCQSEFDSKLSSALPFCSERCREIDLGRWLDEKNSMPSMPDPEADEVPDDNWEGGDNSSSNGPSRPTEETQ